MLGLALFDFDGILIRSDTFIIFIRYSVGKLRFFLGMVFLTFVLILYKLKLIKNWWVKEIVFSYFFKGMFVEKYQKLGTTYVFEEILILI